MTLSIEEQARKLGWHPLEEFKGDPERFTDAETFVKKGEEILPILQENKKKLESRVGHLEKVVKEQVAFNERNLASQRETMQAAYDKELERIVADGDKEAFEKLKKPDFTDAPKYSPEDQQTYNDFIAEHDWYGTDTALTAAAGAISGEIANKFPSLSAEQNLTKTLVRLKTDFPQKFGNGVEEEEEEEEMRPRVEGGRNRIVRRKSEHSYEDLPAESQAVCDNFIKEGIIKDKDAYVATYDWSE